jgi:hypothetical protein
MQDRSGVKPRGDVLELEDGWDCGLPDNQEELDYKGGG